MEYIYSIILAIVQAATEFLPISSSGHLVIAHQVIPSELLNNLSFDVVLHFGTLIALVVYFWSDIIKILKGFFSRQKNADSFLGWLLIMGILPALIVGYFFEDFIEQSFRSVEWVIVMLVVGGILFIVAEKFSSKERDISLMSLSDVLIIGLFQILAFIPGMSRSGITIVGGMLLNFSRKEAAKFSFLMAIPIILIASIKRITQISLDDSSLVFVFILGAAVAALIGYFIIKLLLKFLEKRSLIGFAIYRFCLAIVLIIFFIKL